MRLEIGMTDSITKTIQESDVYTFAELSEDRNSAHTDPEAAAKGIFGKQVAHGMLVGSLISAVLGTKLPGEGTIYMEQDLKFMRPVFFGDTITATVRVSEIINEEKGIYRLDTTETNQDGQVVVSGYAVVKYS